MHTLVVGAGYSGFHIAKEASRHGSVCGTRQNTDDLQQLKDAGMEAVTLSPDDNLPISADVRDQFARTTHLVICNAPARNEPLDDPVLRLFSSGIELPQLEWIGYLSTIGVYGNHNGEWVDEDTPCTSSQMRSIMRRQAEQGWQTQASQWQVPLTIIRLSGIYGPGRSAVDDAIAGRARMLIKPGQVFNRVHVADIARASVLAALARTDAIVNVTDDLPAAPQDVVRYAHALTDRAAPPEIDFATADISDMARSFYSENKRVSNALSKQLLGMQYRYPTYKEGLDARWEACSRL